MKFLESEFISAYESGNFEMAERLLRLGINPDQVIYTDVSIFCDAVNNGHEDFAMLLLEAGASPDFYGSHLPVDMSVPVIWAAKEDKPRLLDKILMLSENIFDGNCLKQDYAEALRIAAVKSHFECLELLLRLGCNPDASCYGQTTPLIEVCRNFSYVKADKKNDMLKCLKALISKGSYINYGDAFNRTPLHNAVFYGAEYMAAEALIEAGAKINTYDNYGETPLITAIKYGSPKEFLELLLETGADPDYAGNGTSVPLMMAAISGDVALANRLI
jgi:ankyrin repeat protein